MKNIDYYGESILKISLSSIGGCIAGRVHECRTGKNDACNNETDCEECKKKALEWLNQERKTLSKEDLIFLKTFVNQEFSIRRDGWLYFKINHDEDNKMLLDESMFRSVGYLEEYPCEELLKWEVEDDGATI